MKLIPAVLPEECGGTGCDYRTVTDDGALI
jgi:hypothetical protein